MFLDHAVIAGVMTVMLMLSFFCRLGTVHLERLEPQRRQALSLSYKKSTQGILGDFGCPFFCACFFVGMGDLRRVYIRCCGNGYLWFRSYSGSLFPRAEKVTKKALLLVRSDFVGFPHSDDAPWARAERTSMS